MDWEWLTGREGEELDGWFPEPDDPKPSHPAYYDQESSSSSDDDLLELYAHQQLIEMNDHLLQNAVDKLGIRDEGYYDEERLQERIDEIGDEIVSWLTFKIKDISSFDQISWIADNLNNLGFFDFFSRHDFEEMLTLSLLGKVEIKRGYEQTYEKNGKDISERVYLGDTIETIEDVIDECYCKIGFRNQYVLPVLNKINERAILEGKTEYTINISAIEKDIQLLFATKIPAFKDPKRYQGTI